MVAVADLHNIKKESTVVLGRTCALSPPPFKLFIVGDVIQTLL